MAAGPGSAKISFWGNGACARARWRRDNARSRTMFCLTETRKITMVIIVGRAENPRQHGTGTDAQPWAKKDWNITLNYHWRYNRKDINGYPKKTLHHHSKLNNIKSIKIETEKCIHKRTAVLFPSEANFKEIKGRRLSVKSGRTYRRRKNPTHLLLNVDFFPCHSVTADDRLILATETQAKGF